MSIALPGFDQFLNGSLFKGCVFIFFGDSCYVLSKFNLAILYSFQGEIQKAINVTNFQWLMFNPWSVLYYNRFNIFNLIKNIWSNNWSCFFPILSLVLGILIGFIIYKLVIIYKTLRNFSNLLLSAS